jgi:subtilisin family serine protease
MRLWCVALLSALLAACAGGERREPPSTDLVTAFDRQILLTVRQPGSLALGLTGNPSQRYVQRRYGPTPSVERILTQIAREHGLDRVDGWTIQSLGVYCEVFAVPGSRSVDEVIATLGADPRVDLVQRMNLFDTELSHYDDPYLDLQSAAVELDVEQAHQLATGRGVSIAIIDSSVDADHPDLRGRVRLSRNLVDPRELGRRAEVHGTAIAGIIASAVNNREGIVGIAPDVSITSLRACWATAENSLAARCSSFSLALALEVALSLRPNVINMSLSGPSDPLLSQLLDRVIERGIVVVAAQPDPEETHDRFPASHPKVLAARSAAEGPDGSSPYSVAAPATEILTTLPGATYAFLSGNSLAAAHTSGVVALLMEREPTLGVERIAALLAGTAVRSSQGGASINACRALAELAGAPMCSPVAGGATF